MERLATVYGIRRGRRSANGFYQFELATDSGTVRTRRDAAINDTLEDMLAGVLPTDGSGAAVILIVDRGEVVNARPAPESIYTQEGSDGPERDDRI